MFDINNIIQHIFVRISKYNKSYLKIKNTCLIKFLSIGIKMCTKTYILDKFRQFFFYILCNMICLGKLCDRARAIF